MSQHLSDRELMHQALEALEWASDMIPQQKEPVCDCPICKASDALRERLAQPEQEPVAWRNKETGEFCTGGFLRKDWARWTPLYTTPPRREWVGLTEEEVDECYYWKGRQWTTDELVRHVEAKLKEKNA